MGWTHAWRRQTELPARAFSLASDEIRTIMKFIGVPISGFNGHGMPIITESSIVFNGTRPSHCEPFEIHQTEFDRHGRPYVRSFCKTERAPYDICVKVALIVLKHHLEGAIEVTSDGCDDDWKDARDICQEGLGYGSDFKLTTG